ncbi:GntR family transcriptional regulator [Microlunatus parietis]|uniref:DNA-binding GntR family transcriptional regulator n=1 Tax=Microlunatus parietis TaxID=682979 RepID=A0A7Y9LDS9_9ACTN|nr:winged helix-turn-helix domain-containing protein [Microlunatus parietis]NYE74237.1 DNA-binding GntR family transcriptional regulator [Microlunatus parietis]
MTIDAGAPQPPYLQIADALRAAISSGELPPGAKLPAGRALARTYGVAIPTAQKAVDELQREGLVRSHGTRGVYVIPAATNDAAENDISSLRKEIALLAARVEALELKLDELR